MHIYWNWNNYLNCFYLSLIYGVPLHGSTGAGVPTRHVPSLKNMIKNTEYWFFEYAYRKILCLFAYVQALKQTSIMCFSYKCISQCPLSLFCLQYLSPILFTHGLKKKSVRKFLNSIFFCQIICPTFEVVITGWIKSHGFITLPAQFCWSGCGKVMCKLHRSCRLNKLWVNKSSNICLVASPMAS